MTGFLADLDAVWLTMWHDALDEAFFEEVLDALKPHFELWAAQKPKRGRSKFPQPMMPFSDSATRFDCVALDTDPAKRCSFH